MLTDLEAGSLVELLKKAEWPLPSEVFHALLGVTISVPIELGVFNEDGHVLMVYRDDWEFRGWHLPGTVVRDNENVAGALTRLIVGEVGVPVADPVDLGWLEFGRDIHPTRHAVSLLHVCSLRGVYVGKGKFFSPEDLPSDTLVHHKLIVPEMIRRMWNNSVKIGK